MSRGGVPKYRKHPNGQAFIEHRSIPNKSRRKFLGRYGTAESRQRYQQAIAQIEGMASVPTIVAGQWPTVNWLIARYLDYAMKHYSRPYGLSSEYDGMVHALGPVSKLFGPTVCSAFSAKSLVAIRSTMARGGAARSTVNHSLSRIKKFWRWCCEQELAPPELYFKLHCVRGLMRGQENCREPERIRPACMASISGLRQFVAPVVADMIQVQYLCGMRPGEVCIMRSCDIDRSAAVWLYRPQRHKNEWRGFAEVKAIPRAAQAILASYLDCEGYIFKPARVRVPNAKARTTIKHPCEIQRVARHARRTARRINRRDHYTTESYRAALRYGFTRAERAGVALERFNPNQLRHAILTLVSRCLGSQAAQCWGGHRDLNTTDIYVEKQIAELIEVANQLEAHLSASA